MLTRFKSPERRPLVFLASLWAVAILFLIARALLPA